MYITWVLFYFIFRSHLSVRACRRLASVSMVLGVTKERRCYLYPSISGWLREGLVWVWLAGPKAHQRERHRCFISNTRFFKTHFAHTALCCWAPPPSPMSVCPQAIAITLVLASPPRLNMCRIRRRPLYLSHTHMHTLLTVTSCLLASAFRCTSSVLGAGLVARLPSTVDCTRVKTAKTPGDTEICRVLCIYGEHLSILK